MGLSNTQRPTRWRPNRIIPTLPEPEPAKPNQAKESSKSAVTATSLTTPLLNSRPHSTNMLCPSPSKPTNKSSNITQAVSLTVLRVEQNSTTALLSLGTTRTPSLSGTLGDLCGVMRDTCRSAAETATFAVFLVCHPSQSCDFRSTHN